MMLGAVECSNDKDSATKRFRVVNESVGFGVCVFSVSLIEISYNYSVYLIDILQFESTTFGFRFGPVFGSTFKDIICLEKQ